MMLKRLGLLPIIALYTVFPLTYSLSKWGLLYGSYSLYVGLRMFISGGAIVLWHAFFKKSSMVIKKQDMHYFLMLGAIAFSISVLAEGWALPSLPIAKASLYFALAPFFTALFAVFHKLDMITPKKLLGLMVGFCGFIPQLFIDNATGCAVGSFKFTRYDLIMLLAVATYAYGWILIKKLSMRTEYDDAWVNGAGMLIGGSLSLLYAIGMTVTGMKNAFIVTNWPQFLSSVTLISGIGIFCYLLYTALMHYFTVTLVSFFCFLEVPFALFFGYLFLQEHVSYVSFISTAVIAVGLYLFYQEELRLGR